MNYTLIDSHCHPQASQFDVDRDAVIQRALQSGVGMICIGTDIQASRHALELADKYEGLYTSVGSHPTDESHEVFDLSAYESLMTHPRVVAVGEIGLDHFHEKDLGAREHQKDRFLQQLGLAQKYLKPIIIHCRDAHADMIKLLREKASGTRGVIHSFNGTMSDARAYLDLGWHLGLNAIITYSPSYHEMVRSLPLDRILLETDAPYLTPAPYRGKRNEPSYVQYVAQAVADIKSVSLESLQKQTVQNTRDLFSI